MTLKRLTLILGLIVSPLVSAQIPGVDIDGPFVRVKRNEDGTKTEFSRGNDRKTLTKKTYSAQKRVVMTTVYRLDDRGNPLKCDIFDGAGNKLYKTSFGYSKRPGPTFGKLVQELLFDVRVKRYFDLPDANGKRKEKPVHMFIYSYNADGSANLPVGMTLIKGKTAEEVFGTGVESQVIPNLEEFEKVEPANPNARPVGR
ncbi:hypothetical protein [Haloferula sp.]|uniref:hypothetical protein n=1 Tax=Haloferula sp. TaxID=2497595 RepID=UPI003C72B4D0